MNATYMKKGYLSLFLTIVTFLAVHDVASADTYSSNQSNASYQAQWQYNTSAYQTNYWQNSQYQEQQLQTLLEQHASVGAQTFIAQYDQNPNFPNLQQQVSMNTQQLTSFMNYYMGSSASQQFQQLWQRHIDDLTNYTNATKNGDQNAKQQAVQDLNGFVHDFTNFFLNQTNNGQNTMYDQYGSQFQQMMQTHINDEESIIDAHASGNDSQVTILEQQATSHADMMAQLMWQTLMQNNQNNNISNGSYNNQTSQYQYQNQYQATY